jgi:hypothetical protein
MESQKIDQGLRMASVERKRSSSSSNPLAGVCSKDLSGERLATRGNQDDRAGTSRRCPEFHLMRWKSSSFHVATQRRSLDSANADLIIILVHVVAGLQARLSMPLSV